MIVGSKTNQLAKLIKKYDVRLLLAECNIHLDKTMADMSDMQAAKAVVKTRKVPLRST